IAKTLGAGTGLVTLGVILCDPLPAGRVLAATLTLGALAYGASVLLDAFALRHLGAAREAAFFATAPFAGAPLPVRWRAPLGADAGGGAGGAPARRRSGHDRRRGAPGPGTARPRAHPRGAGAQPSPRARLAPPAPAPGRHGP